ncbi:MAG: hypothetical protein KGO82_19175 [Bacteroidota bacterium]|nr:hypothetical protein [Bacteroidota bacterium]
MVYLKNSPVGLDIPIQKYQQFLYNELKSIWPVDDTSMEGYGRCYRSLGTEGNTPQVFVASAALNNTLYKDAEFVDDVHKAVFFFVAGDSNKYDHGDNTARVSVIFMVNAALLKPSIQHRADEEIRLDVMRLALRRTENFEMTEVVTGIRNVFAEFDGWLKTDQVVYRDNHPLHCFRINYSVTYDMNSCN